MTAAPVRAVHLPAASDLVLVSGPPGSGRSTVLRSVCVKEPVTGLTATALLLDGARAWAGAFSRAWRRSVGSIWVDDVDLLPDELLAAMNDWVGDGSGASLALTSGPRAGLTGRAAALATRCRHIELGALRDRQGELATLTRALALDLAPRSTLRLTPPVIEALRSQDWPGNLHELRAVMAHVTARRTTGDVTLADLPPDYRSVRRGRCLNALERAERDVIRRELLAQSGNKSRTANALGISRTTLYARIRALGISRC